MRHLCLMKHFMLHFNSFIVVRIFIVLIVTTVLSQVPLNVLLSSLRGGHFGGVSLPPFCSPVLEPNLYLRFSHSQGVSKFGPLRACKVLGLLEGFFQGENLLPGECGSCVLLLPVFVEMISMKIIKNKSVPPHSRIVDEPLYTWPVQGCSLVRGQLGELPSTRQALVQVGVGQPEPGHAGQPLRHGGGGH